MPRNKNRKLSVNKPITEKNNSNYLQPQHHIYTKPQVNGSVTGKPLLDIPSAYGDAGTSKTGTVNVCDGVAVSGKRASIQPRADQNHVDAAPQVRDKGAGHVDPGSDTVNYLEKEIQGTPAAPLNRMQRRKLQFDGVDAPEIGAQRRTLLGLPVLPAEVGISSGDKLLAYNAEGRIQQFEGHRILSSNKGIDARASMKSLIKLPNRDGVYGEAGQKILLHANHYKVTFLDNAPLIYQYDITITDLRDKGTGKNNGSSIQNRDLCRFALSSVVNKFISIFRFHPAFDGGKFMFTPIQVPNKEIDLDPLEYEGRERSLHLKILKVGEINFNDVKAYVSPSLRFRSSRLKEKPHSSFSALDIIFKFSQIRLADSKLMVAPVGRGIYFSDTPQKLSANLDVWHGWVPSFRPAQGWVSLNADRDMCIFYKPQPLLHLIAEHCKVKPQDSAPRLIDAWKYRDNRALTLIWNNITMLSKQLNGLKIKTIYNGLTRKIRSFSKKSAKDECFICDELGGEVSVMDYFSKKFSITLQFGALPLINVGSMQKSSYVPLELCNIHRGQSFKKKLTGKNTLDLLTIAAVPPATRKQEIDRILRQACTARHQKYLSRFGIRIHTTMTTVEGRVLPPPTLQCGVGKPVPKNGKWDMRANTFYECNNVDGGVSFGVIGFGGHRRNEREIRDFCNILCKHGCRSGLKLNALKREDVLFLQTDSFAIEEAMRLFMRQKKQFVIVLLPDWESNGYNKVKSIGDVKMGYLTQCLRMKTVLKCDLQTIDNLLLKINGKTGGVNTRVEFLPVYLNTSGGGKQVVLYMGADVTHPVPQDRDIKPSIAAIVGSLDLEGTRYTAVVQAQQNRQSDKKRVQEIIVGIREAVKVLINRFRYYNKLKIWPQTIVFYRDGVSESQLEEVLTGEVEDIRRGCLDVRPNYRPNVVHMVVQKRHHTRFFPTDHRNTVGRGHNIPPGTAVDRDITMPVEHDFFLASHEGLQGTTRPCHYCVLANDPGWSPDTLQQLSYYMCHVYARCCNSVSIPTPAYYAHLVAFRARAHVLGGKGRADCRLDDSRSPSPSSISPENLDRIQRDITVNDNLEPMYFI